MNKEKKGRIIKIVVTVVIVVLVAWIFFIYPMSYFHNNEEKLKAAAKHYFEINYRELPKNDEVITLTLSDLSSQKYIEDLFVPYTKQVCDVTDSWVKVRKEGDEYKYYTYLKCGYLSSGVDHTGPEITLAGDKEIIVDRGDEYKDAGVKSVYDQVDKEINVSEVHIQNDDIDTSKLGTYKIKYTAYDSLNNVTTVERVVKVVQKLSGIINKDTNNSGYYKGNVDNNYLRFSGMLFRIVGIDKNQNIRVVTENDIANVNYDGIQSWLDNYYYAHLTENAKKFLTEGSVCSERLASTDNVSGCSETEKKHKVGLLSADDYAKSLDSGNSYLYTNRIVWIANDKTDNQAWTARNWYIGVAPTVKNMEFNKNYSFGVRPVLTIKKDTLIQGGTGVVSDPYLLGDMTKARANSKLNQRISGEYVEYGGYKFRIIERESNGTTKAIMEDVLKIKNDVPKVSYASTKDKVQYNPTEKGNIGYVIEHQSANYIKTKLLANYEMEVPIYKDYALYGKAQSNKKYKVKFIAPSMHEMFSTSSANLESRSYWYRDSSLEEGRKYLVLNAGTIDYEKVYGGEAEMRVVVHFKKDVTISDGNGTNERPYTLVE